MAAWPASRLLIAWLPCAGSPLVFVRCAEGETDENGHRERDGMRERERERERPMSISLSCSKGPRVAVTAGPAGCQSGLRAGGVATPRLGWPGPWLDAWLLGHPPAGVRFSISPCRAQRACLSSLFPRPFWVADSLAGKISVGQTAGCPIELVYERWL